MIGGLGTSYLDMIDLQVSAGRIGRPDVAACWPRGGAEPRYAVANDGPEVS